jgi:hypothetical protein
VPMGGLLGRWGLQRHKQLCAHGRIVREVGPIVRGARGCVLLLRRLLFGG